MPVARECAVCGKEFQSKPAEHRKYCSKACMYSRNNTTRDCEACGKMFRSPPSQLHVRTCSTECGYKIRRVANAKGVTFKAISETGKVTWKRHKPHITAHNAKRRATRLQATVGWADTAKVGWFYTQAKILTDATGMVYHVDHIVPLTSKLVCGLHNEFNLQLLPGTENVRKHNRHWPDMP